jgi:hypothetical protein
VAAIAYLHDPYGDRDRWAIGHEQSHGDGPVNPAVNAKLDDLSRWAIGLPPDQRSAVLVGLGGVLIALASMVRQADGGRNEVAGGGNSDRLLTVEEAARKLATTPNRLYHHPPALQKCEVRLLGNDFRYSERALDELIKANLGRAR